MNLVINDLILCNISFATLYIQWYQLIPHKAHFSALLGATYITASTLDAMTLSVIDPNTFLQEVDPVEHSTTFFSSSKQALYAFR
jgi:hypothetical protein